MKIWVRLALLLYVKKISVSFKQHPRQPIILACNHPNSFLDALIIGSHYKKPIHFLARGDAFSKPFINKLLRGLNMIPIFRMSEGRKQLENNQDTFTECLGVLQEKGIIAIFSEGICKNETTIRDLKKGTSRLASMAWHERGISELSIIPVTLLYSSFTNVPMSIYVREGELISKKQFPILPLAKFHAEFNQVLEERLEKTLGIIHELLQGRTKNIGLKKILLAIPALIGWTTHFHFYKICRNIARRKTQDTVFFHSVLFAILLIIYPITVFIITLIFVLLTKNFMLWLLMLLLPLSAYCYKEYKSLNF